MAVEGLSSKEAARLLKVYGENVLHVKKSKSVLRLLLAQFNSPLIYMLLFAAILSLLLYDNTDAFIIFGIILASSLLTFFQERGALESMEKLLEVVQIKAEVVRDGASVEIAAEKVVPGDIVLLKAGDVVPADCRLLEAANLFVDEATLTGESFYTEKFPGEVAQDAPLAKRTNTLFMGTHVVSGHAKACVEVTGTKSEFGKISTRLRFQPPETEFEHGVRRFGYFLGEVTLILLVIIFACNVYLGRSAVESMLFSLALAVGLTPQLLPAIISVNLAHGAKMMAKKKVIVKRLASIENFGSMNILCADKTGTLTTGDIKLDSAVGVDGEKSEKVHLFASINSALQTGYKNSIDDCLMRESHPETNRWQKLDELPYDFVRRRLSIVAKKDNQKILITKGAFREVLGCCTMCEVADGKQVPIQSVAKDLEKRFEEYANQGFRVLSIAYKLQPEREETGLTFLGYLLFWNPPKENIVETISELNRLGIQLKIITGDNLIASLHLAKAIGIASDEVITGSQIAKMSDRALLHHAMRASIFAEVEPNQKERIILALRKAGGVVGFIGDGINDVTALHAADVSISVDAAADAAKEVADIVLLKRDLLVLKDGVIAGRMTFANTLKYIFMSTSANFGNMFSMAGASLFLPFLPLLPKQVLLTNLLTDLPEMTIATDHVDKEMLEKPLRWNVQFIRKFMLIFGLISSIFDYVTFGVLLWILNASETQFRTGWFLESVVSATLIVLVVRTFRPFYSSMPSKYLLTCVLIVVFFTSILAFTPLAPYLGFSPLPASFYLFLGLIVIAYIAMVELAKKLFLQNASSGQVSLRSHPRPKPVFHW